MIERACVICGTLSDQQRCPEHRRRQKDTRPNAARRGYGGRWVKAARAYISTHPFCECGPECCPQGCGRPATQVDHIDGLGPKGPRGYDPDNFQALAHGCHSRKTAREHGFGSSVRPNTAVG